MWGVNFPDTREVSHLIKEGLGKKNESSAHALYYGHYVSTLDRPAGYQPRYGGTPGTRIEIDY